MYSKEQLLEFYRTMVRIRTFEEKAAECFTKGMLAGNIHLSIGQEGAEAGAFAAIQPQDYFTSTHRGHGHVIARGGDRVGIYYLETGASMRPSKVIYDRAHSSIAEADPQDFDFDAIMEGADWFHWSGITPAISDKAAELTRLACEAARRHGVTVSVDLNFRKKLWTKEKAQSIMKPLMQYVDVCIGNEEDAELCLGFKPDADVEGGETNAEGYKGIFRQMAATFGFKYVIVLGDAQRLESHDLQRQGVLRVEALRHRSDHRPRGRRRLVLGRRDPRPADQADAGRGPGVRRGGIGPEAYDQRRLQPRIGRGGRVVGRRQCQRTGAEKIKNEKLRIKNYGSLQ